jgi:hypothetical protein
MTGMMRPQRVLHVDLNAVAHVARGLRDRGLRFRVKLPVGTEYRPSQLIPLPRYIRGMASRNWKILLDWGCCPKIYYACSMFTIQTMVL